MNNLEYDPITLKNLPKYKHELPKLDLSKLPKKIEKVENIVFPKEWLKK